MFDYLLVDETQDTSQVQWDFARILAEWHGNLFLVGDVGSPCTVSGAAIRALP